MATAPEPPGEVTRLLLAWQNGSRDALDRLMDLVHREVKAIAAARMRRERGGHTLQPTALVNEAYLRLVDQNRVNWRDRAHFFAVAAEMMRRVLIDHAKRARRLKRGGGARSVAFEESRLPGLEPEVDLLDLHGALSRLGRLDRRQEKIVELRYFGGLTIEETAAALALSPATVKREWSSARAWLYRELGGGEGRV